MTYPTTPVRQEPPRAPDLLAQTMAGAPVAHGLEAAILLRMAAWAWRQATDLTQYQPVSVPRAFLAAFELSDIERDHTLRSAINSLALEGVHVTREEASRLLDEVLLEPLPDIG